MNALPDACGVYLLKDAAGDIVYIGKSNSIRKRVSSHLRTKLAQKVSSVDHILTKGELSALILEAKLIKKFRPRYNISMRDDKQYPYIRLSMNEEFPAVKIVRKKAPDGAAYFGPFRSAGARLLASAAARIFGLRKCSSGVFRKRQQPCLNFYMKRCAAPCTGGIGRRAYRARALQAKKFFESGPDGLLSGLKNRMNAASAKKKYEEAAALRDRIFLIERSVDSYTGKKTTGVRDREALQELMRYLQLKAPPFRMEAFDISNTGPSQTVGAMAVFVNGKPLKQDYRRFKISSRELPNDIAAIYETVYRRYSGSLKDKLPLPDLVVVDGGPAQRSSAEKAIRDARQELALISLAKKNEEIFCSQTSRPLVLPRDSKALLLLRAIRDEVHRFAVSYHRARRRKTLVS